MRLSIEARPQVLAPSALTENGARGWPLFSSDPGKASRVNIRRSRRWRRIPLPCSVWLSTIWRTTRQPLREAGRATRARERSSGRAEGGGRTQEPAALPRSTIVVRRDVCHSTARNLKLSDCKLIIVHFATFNLRPHGFGKTRIVESPKECILWVL